MIPACSISYNMKKKEKENLDMIHKQTLHYSATLTFGT